MSFFKNRFVKDALSRRLAQTQTAQQKPRAVNSECTQRRALSVQTSKAKTVSVLSLNL